MALLFYNFRVATRCLDDEKHLTINIPAIQGHQTLKYLENGYLDAFHKLV